VEVLKVSDGYIFNILKYTMSYIKMVFIYKKAMSL
jgi:hypothetical protein